MEKMRWVDIAKCVAILAVMTDHMRGSLYGSNSIQEITYFSVTLFILLMGVTTYWSFENPGVPFWEKVVKRIKSIFIPYIVAVFVYNCFAHKSFSWTDFWHDLILFDAAGPHYYVLLYIMLVTASPVLFCLIKKNDGKLSLKSVLYEVLLGIVLFFLARICNLYTDFAGIYAIRLFGGSYLLCLYLGMLFGRHYPKSIEANNKKYVFLILSLVLTTAMAILIYSRSLFLDKYTLLGSVVNPPGITLIVYAFSIMICIWLSDHIICRLNITLFNSIAFVVAYIGKHTLYIFLYHILLLRLLNVYSEQIPRLIKIPLYYLVMIFVSILIGLFYQSTKDYIVKCYLNTSKKNE